MKKRVSFGTVTVLYILDDEDRCGTWASDGERFRQRVRALEVLLTPIFQQKLIKLNTMLYKSY